MRPTATAIIYAFLHLCTAYIRIIFIIIIHIITNWSKESITGTSIPSLIIRASIKNNASWVSYKSVGCPAKMLSRPRWERNYSKWEWCVWVCGWGGGCSDDCGLDLRLTTWEERLVCFHNMFLMTQVHAVLMTYILFASWWQRRTNNQCGATALKWIQ